MDNLHNLSIAFTLIGGAVASIALAVFQGAQPSLGALIPVMIAYLVHRFVKNQQAAALIGKLASAAYLHLASQFSAAGGIKPKLGPASQIAVNAAIEALGAGASGTLKGSAAKISFDVAAQLGKLLAADAAFQVTDPHNTASLVRDSPPAGTAVMPAPATAPAQSVTASFDVTTLAAAVAADVKGAQK